MDLVEAQGPLVAWEKTVKHMEVATPLPRTEYWGNRGSGPCRLLKTDTGRIVVHVHRYCAYDPVIEVDRGLKGTNSIHFV
jgi:hypothetical protein